MNTKTIMGISLAAIFAVSMVALTSTQETVAEPPPSKVVKEVIVQNEILEGLASGALYPFTDTTPHLITSAHVAITDSTSNCDGDNANGPDNISLLVGVAGGDVTSPTFENTGIGEPNQCVFHATIVAGENGIPSEITDIVVINNGPFALDGYNTITVSAQVLEQ